MLSIDAALLEARTSGLDLLDAQVLLAHQMGQNRTWLRAHGDHLLNDAELLGIRTACEQRARGTPVAYLTGEREFYGLRLRITPAVLDPRPDTEVLVDWALHCLRGPLAAHQRPVVADLGTGSGAIALAIAQHAPQAQVIGVDRSPSALAVARENGERLGLPVDWRLGPWFKPLAGPSGNVGQPIQLIVSNPPYIAESDPHLATLHAEPGEALVSGIDGLDDLRHLAAHAGRCLTPGGWLLLEHGFDQGVAVAHLLRSAGFDAVEHRQDLAGHTRCTGGLWPGFFTSAYPPDYS